MKRRYTYCQSQEGSVYPFFACIIWVFISFAVQAGTWIEIPGTHMREVCPSESVSPSTRDCAAVIESWSGGAFDSAGNRMFLMGGGHNGYYGNEVYEFDLDTEEWARLTDSTTPAADADTVCYSTWDGGLTPTARHTYNHLAWVNHLNELFLFGGVTSCRNGGNLQDSWTFDPNSGRWDRRKRTSPVGDNFVQVIYEPASQKIYAKKNSGAEKALYSFDFSMNMWIKEVSGIDLDMLYRTGTLDTRRHQIWFVGDGAVNTLLLHPPFTLESIATMGGDAIINAGSPGVAYDPLRDKIVAWCGASSLCGSTQANEVYILDPVTLTWTVDMPAGDGPSRNNGSAGTFGRWRYSPKSDVFIAINSVDRNVWLYRPDPLPLSDEEQELEDPRPSKSRNFRDRFLRSGEMIFPFNSSR
ncbi:Kelch repeat protein [Nitrosococcus halophilus Nc 4]|uniref:Kelch repeat protein n=1 Tax=Nitrosococcus halophilus (strain Nc4) TaxID=472759 RepID=D5C032_NITHN|nr:kelch repeat-containing protein [Nitrosococcus halophilus]ADE16279.1 Kelch repeat protein [Nitrosococcus halophilus Nc 4]